MSVPNVHQRAGARGHGDRGMTSEALDTACRTAEAQGMERMFLKRPISDPRRYAKKNRAQLLPGVSGTICQSDFGALVLAVRTEDVRRYLARHFTSAVRPEGGADG